MVGRLNLTGALSVSLIGSLHAQSGPPLPPLVEAARRDVCDGAPAKTAPGFLQSGDLNGDGRPDYVFDQSKAECTSGAPSSCGSGGCSIEAYVSSPKRYHRIDLGILGFNPTIDTKSSPPQLIVSQRSGQVLAYRWNGSTFERSSSASAKPNSNARLAGAKAPAGSPTEVVSTVIAASRSKRSSLFSFGGDPTPQMRKLFTTAFNQAWVRSFTNGGGIDGDPITGRQQVSNVTLKSVEAGSAGADSVTVVARVSVSIGGVPADETISFAMRKELGAWKVDDIVDNLGPSGPRMEPLRVTLRKEAEAFAKQ